MPVYLTQAGWKTAQKAAKSIKGDAAGVPDAIKLFEAAEKKGDAGGMARAFEKLNKIFIALEKANKGNRQLADYIKNARAEADAGQAEPDDGGANDSTSPKTEADSEKQPSTESDKEGASEKAVSEKSSAEPEPPEPQPKDEQEAPEQSDDAAKNEDADPKNDPRLAALREKFGPDVAAHLDRAKTKGEGDARNFVLAARSDWGGLIVTNRKINDQARKVAKALAGGKGRFFEGTCYGGGGKHVFKFSEEPSQKLMRVLKAAALVTAGKAIKVKLVGPTTQLEDDELPDATGVDAYPLSAEWSSELKRMSKLKGEERAQAAALMREKLDEVHAALAADKALPADERRKQETLLTSVATTLTKIAGDAPGGGAAQDEAEAKAQDAPRPGAEDWEKRIEATKRVDSKARRGAREAILADLDTASKAVEADPKFSSVAKAREQRQLEGVRREVKRARRDQAAVIRGATDAGKSKQVATLETALERVLALDLDPQAASDLHAAHDQLREALKRDDAQRIDDRIANLAEMLKQIGEAPEPAKARPKSRRKRKQLAAYETSLAGAKADIALVDEGSHSHEQLTSMLAQAEALAQDGFVKVATGKLDDVRSHARAKVAEQAKGVTAASINKRLEMQEERAVLVEAYISGAKAAIRAGVREIVSDLKGLDEPGVSVTWEQAMLDFEMRREALSQVMLRADGLQKRVETDCNEWLNRAGNKLSPASLDLLRKDIRHLKDAGLDGYDPKMETRLDAVDKVRKKFNAGTLTQAPGKEHFLPIVEELHSQIAACAERITATAPSLDDFPLQERPDESSIDTEEAKARLERAGVGDAKQDGGEDPTARARRFTPEERARLRELTPGDVEAREQKRLDAARAEYKAEIKRDNDLLAAEDHADKHAFAIKTFDALDLFGEFTADLLSGDPDKVVEAVTASLKKFDAQLADLIANAPNGDVLLDLATKTDKEWRATILAAVGLPADVVKEDPTLGPAVDQLVTSMAKRVRDGFPGRAELDDDVPQSVTIKNVKYGNPRRLGAGAGGTAYRLEPENGDGPAIVLKVHNKLSKALAIERGDVSPDTEEWLTGIDDLREEMAKEARNHWQVCGGEEKECHENVLAMTGVVLGPSGEPYEVMEVAAGGDALQFTNAMTAAADSGLISENARAAMAKNAVRQIVKGMKSMHENCLIHEDLKEDNVFMSEDGTFKVADFGYSDRIENPDATAQTTAMTRGYEPFETRTSDAFSQQRDIFTLGVVLDNMLAPEKRASIRKELQEGGINATLVVRAQNRTEDGSVSAVGALDRLRNAMLDPNPSRRPTLDGVLQSAYFADLQDIEDQEVPEGEEDAEEAKLSELMKASAEFSAKAGSRISKRQKLINAKRLKLRDLEMERDGRKNETELAFIQATIARHESLVDLAEEQLKEMSGSGAGRLQDSIGRWRANIRDLKPQAEMLEAKIGAPPTKERLAEIDKEIAEVRKEIAEEEAAIAEILKSDDLQPTLNRLKAANAAFEGR